MRTYLSQLERSALLDLVIDGEFLCFEGAHWAKAGFERDPEQLPKIVPKCSYGTVTIKRLVQLGYASYGLGKRRVKPTKSGCAAVGRNQK